MTVVQEDPQLQHNKDLQRQKIKWANPFRNKTNQSTKSFRNTVFNNKNNAAQSSGKFIKRGFNGLGGTHKVHMTKKKSLITNHMLMKKKNSNKRAMERVGIRFWSGGSGVITGTYIAPQVAFLKEGELSNAF